MARLIAERDSTALHLNLARRHQRLARRYQQAALVTAIGTVIDALKARQQTVEDREFDRQGAYDDVVAADADLDDGIRNLFSAAESFDRNNLGAGTLAQLFPDGGFSSIIDEPLAQEPAVADALATKVEAFGASHALFPHAAKVKALAQAVREALAALDQAVRAVKSADAEEEIAQTAVRRQYEGNYLTARQTIGRTVAERLFPKANRGQGGQGGDTPAPADPGTPKP